MSAGAYPPERIEVDDFVLRRPTLRDDVLVAEAVADNLYRLAPHMPWATPQSATRDVQRERLTQELAKWTAHESYQYLAVTRKGTLLGTFALERRIGPAALELGYWLALGAVGRGVATRASRALTEVALALPGVDRVEIHVDEANTRSRRIPQRLGYRLDRVEVGPALAPAQSGRHLIWVYPPPFEVDHARRPR